MIHTPTEIDNLVELAIIQRAELKKLVESLPQLRDHLSSEIERNLEEIEPAIRSELEQLPGIGFVESASGGASSYKDFSITIDPTRFGMTRDAVRRALAARGIETRTYYDPPCHRQTAFEHFHDRARQLKATEMLSARSLSLPIGAHVDEAVVDEVCDAVATAKNL